MKKSLLLVLVLLIVQGEVFSATPSEKELLKQLENTCAGQVMSLAATVRLDNSGKLKRHAFSDKTDSTFFWYFKKVKELVEAPDAAANREKLQKLYGDLAAFARKKTPRTMDACLKFMMIAQSFSQKHCSHLTPTEPDFQSKMNACTEKAMNNPVVMIASEEWKLVQKNLIFK